MKNKIFLIIFGIFLISFISAYGISVTPSTIDLGTVYPNENLSYNVTINAEGNDTIYFNSSNQYIKIYPENIILNSTSQVINLTFYILPNAPPDNISINITSFLIAEDLESSGSISSNHGSSGGGYWTYGTPIKNNTINKTNQTGTIKLNETKNESNNTGIAQKENPKGISWIVWIIIIIISIVIIIILYFLLRIYGINQA